MTTEDTRPNSARAPGGRAGVYAFLLIAVAGGVYAGTRWHSTFAPLLGIAGPAADSGETGGGAADPSASDQLWTCGMHPQVIQDHPGDCPICHMKLTPLTVDPDAGSDGAAHIHSEMSEPTSQRASPPDLAGPTTAQRTIKYWWDPMLNPPYIADRPGKSPMGMDLIPVYEDEGAGSGTPVTIDPSMVQNMGVRVALVTEGPLARTVRLVGYLDEAQPNIREINLRVSGWIGRLYANTEGQHVEAGDPLFDLSSPELQVAIEELINGRRAKAALLGDADESTRQTAAMLYDAAVSKLEWLGLERAQIEALAKLDVAPVTVTFVSPITGHVTEKPIVEGAAVRAGDRVLEIVDHSTLWLDAQAFEKDLPFVMVGQTAVATIASSPGQVISGEIISIQPHVDPVTRTAMVRMAIPNPTLGFKPGMYATVHVRAEIVERAVMVPREAIIDAGDTQISFVAQAVGRFEPRTVRMGLAGEDGMVQVIEGLVPGEAVVTSGQFLLDSESRLREAIQRYLNQRQRAPNMPDPTSPSSEHTDHEAVGMDGSNAREQPGATAQTPTTSPQQLDAVVSAYVDISAALGTEQLNTTPLDVSALITSADALQADVLGSSFEPLALGVAEAAEAMRGQPIDRQREAFKLLSKRVITLVDALPPSGELEGPLFVMHCSMTSSSWIQRSNRVANPFYATGMKNCGTLVHAVTTQGEQP